jgi:hypothetical protein
VVLNPPELDCTISIGTRQVPRRVESWQSVPGRKVARMRRLLLAGVLAATLVLGLVIGAWADVPDTQPNTPDPTRVLWFCVAPNSTAYKNVWALDNSQGACPTPGYTKVPVVVAIPS